MAISGTGKNGGTGDMIKCSEDLWISFWHHDFLAFRGLNGWSDLWNPQMLTDLDAGCPLVNVYKTYGKSSFLMDKSTISTGPFSIANC